MTEQQLARVKALAESAKSGLEFTETHRMPGGDLEVLVWEKGSAPDRISKEGRLTHVVVGSQGQVMGRPEKPVLPKVSRVKTKAIIRRIKENFPLRREGDRRIDDDGIRNSAFWPGQCGESAYCGYRLSEIDFHPERVAGRPPTIRQIVIQLEDHLRLRAVG